MKKSILKKHPLKMAGAKVRSYKKAKKDDRIAVPEIITVDDDKVLVLNIYRPEDISAGQLAPAYRIFQSRIDFIMEDLVAGKWRTANWKCFHEANENSYKCYEDKWNSTHLVDKSDGNMIKSILDSKELERHSWNYAQYSKNPLLLIRDEQDRVLERRCEKKRENRRKKIRRDMEGIKDCDEGFLEWAEEEGLYWSRFIFYKYTGRKQLHGICTHCKQEVILDRNVPRHNKEGICPLCKSPVTFIAAGKKPRYMEHWTRVSKLDRIGRKIVYREFELCKSYSSIEPRDWTFKCEERIRTVFDEHGNDHSYKSLGYYSTKSVEHWQNKMNLSSYASMLCPVNLRDVLAGSKFEHCALEEYVKHNPREKIFPAGYLTAYRNCPAIEYFTKLGMFKMAREIMEYNSVMNRLLPGKKLREILGITSDRELQLARSNQVGLCDFKNVQEMLEEGVDLKDKEFVTLLELYYYKDLVEYNDLLPLRKLCNYIARQVEKGGKSKGCRLGQDVKCFSEAEKRAHRDMLNLWRDYIRFCKEVGYELDSIPVLCPGNLHQAHDRVSWEYQDMRDRERKAEQKRRDRRLNAMLKREAPLLSGKIKNKKYELVVPRSAADIRKEGRVLGHCVGSYTDMILEGKCQIYFIRKAGETQKPYYTVEWRDGKIAQCRGERNCGYNEEMGRFLSSAQKKLLRIHEAAEAA